MSLNFQRMLNNKGMALISVLMVFTVLFILGVALLQVALADTGQATWQSDRVQAHYLARSGVHQGIRLLENSLDAPTPFTGTIAELAAQLNAMTSGSPYTIPDVGTYTLQFEEGLYSGEIKILSTGTVAGRTNVNQTVTYTKALGDTFNFSNPAREWMTGINLEKAIKPSNSGESYIGEAVLLETKNSKNAVQSPKGGRPEDDSTFQASVIVFREYKNISLRQITQSIELTFDAEVILFTGDIILNKNSTPLKLTVSNEILINHTTNDNSSMVQNILGYGLPTGFEDRDRYLEFIGESAFPVTGSYYEPTDFSGGSFGVMKIGNVWVDTGSTTTPFLAGGYYYYRDDTDLRTAEIGAELISIPDDDPIVDVLNSLLGISMGPAPAMWNDK